MTSQTTGAPRTRSQELALPGRTASFQTPMLRARTATSCVEPAATPSAKSPWRKAGGRFARSFEAKQSFPVGPCQLQVARTQALAVQFRTREQLTRSACGLASEMKIQAAADRKLARLGPNDPNLEVATEDHGVQSPAPTTRLQVLQCPTLKVQSLCGP